MMPGGHPGFGSPGEGPCAAGIGFDAALSILIAHALPLGLEEVAIYDAGARRLAADLHARIDGPRQDVAAMDGYAIIAPAGGGSAYRATATVYAGGRGRASIANGEALRVMTGAPVPPEAERVVMIEHCSVDGDSVHIMAPDGGKPHIRRGGSDFRRGDLLLDAGAMLTPAALVAAAAGDHATLPVWRLPRLGLIATGDELTSPGMAAASALGIPDSISAAIAELARRWGGVAAPVERCGDDAELISSACVGTDADILILTGGASRGDRDLCRAALLASGMRPIFADVLIRPGKPFWYGRLGEKHILGLPGNPTAALTTARLFLAPLLTALGGGHPGTALAWRSRPAIADIVANGPREAFLCGRVTGEGVELLDRQEASGQAMLAQATHLVRRSAGAAACKAGEALAILEL